jgi:hypothetical protein
VLKNLKPAIFLHIQKTAGTTIVELARSAYGDQNVISHGDYLKGIDYCPCTGVVGVDEKLLDDFDNIPFLSGHFGYGFAKRYMPGRYSFTFLREPIERVLSFYYFCRGCDPKQYAHYKLSQQVTLDEFLQRGMVDPEIKNFIWNNQVWQLASGFGELKTRPLSAFKEIDLLELACEHLDEFSHVGFAETFEADRDHILRDLGIVPPEARVVLNANLGRPIYSDLPQSTKDLLFELTELDRVLYQKARLRKMPPMKQDTSERPGVYMTQQSESPEALLPHMQNDYLELMQACLTGSVYRDYSQETFGSGRFDLYAREHGLDWPSHAQTMIGEKRLANLRALTEAVLADNVPGDFIETGVWRGGACILMRAVLYAHNISDRSVWVADSFQGLPRANEAQYPADAGSDFHTYAQLAVSLDEVRDNFRAYGLLDEQVKFLKGWFKDTLPTAPIGQLALMRLDGDMYESTMDAMTHLYPKLSPQGYVIIDDYHVVPACKAAVDDYCRRHGLQPNIVEIDGVGVYWRKSVTPVHEGASNQLCQRGPSTALHIAHLSQAVAELSRRAINHLNQSLMERDESLTEREEQITRLNRYLVERDAKITHFSQSLADLYSSTSWKITKPLRAARSFIAGTPLSTKESEIRKGLKNEPWLKWKDDSHLTINDVHFHLSYDTEELQSGQSSGDIFLLGKSRHLVEKAVAIGQQQPIRKIFEMGILKGGSIVLYDQIYQLQLIVAIDHSPEPVDALIKYIGSHNKSKIIKPYYSINQADRVSMEKVLSLEFPHRDIDLIVDDASHFYVETREAFNISFPYLKEGGLYAIEDWAWAHWTGDYWQKEENPFLAGKPAMSNLLIELFMLAASRPDFIRDIVVDHNSIIVRRGSGALPKGQFNIADHYLLRGKQFGHWL